MAHQHEFKCASCGEVDTVPFEPRDGLLCKECHKAAQEIRRRRSTRQRHNTRVSLPITCARCGKHETLDYMPKGKKLTELLCTECAEEELGGASEWKEVQRDRQHENRRSWRVSCDECGVDIYLPKKPRKGQFYLCEACDRDHVRASGDALEGDTERISGGVHRRSGK